MKIFVIRNSATAQSSPKQSSVSPDGDAATGDVDTSARGSFNEIQHPGVTLLQASCTGIVYSKVYHRPRETPLIQVWSSWKLGRRQSEGDRDEIRCYPEQFHLLLIRGTIEITTAVGQQGHMGGCCNISVLANCHWHNVIDIVMLVNNDMMALWGWRQGIPLLVIWTQQSY